MKVQVISAFKDDIWYAKCIGEVFEVRFVPGTIIYIVIGKYLNSERIYIRNEDCISIDVMRERKLNEMLK